MLPVALVLANPAHTLTSPDQVYSRMAVRVYMHVRLKLLQTGTGMRPSAFRAFCQQAHSY